MVAIVDGGSTKCDWVILDDFKQVFMKTETIGFNPNNIAAELIVPEIEKNLHLASVRNSITKIFFYGSGCGVPENCATIERELGKYFNKAEVVAKEDLTAAAYAASPEYHHGHKSQTTPANSHHTESPCWPESD